MYIDTHCHLDFPTFDHDRRAVMRRARNADVSGMLIAGVQPSGWPVQRELQSRYDGIYWTAGLHPVYVAKVSREQLNDDIEALSQLLSCGHGPCGIGELGLDRRFAPPDTMGQQREAFRAQLALARAFDQPIVLHIVGAHGPAMEVMRQDQLPAAGGVVHSFSGSYELARQYIDMGLHLGVSTAICRGRNKKIQVCAERIPLEWLMIETDCPDQGVEPDSRNEPAELVRVAEHIAQLRGCQAEEILARSANFKDLFQVGCRPNTKE